MVKLLLSFTLSVLRWINWLIHYAMVYPLAMMAALVVLVFCTKNILWIWLLMAVVFTGGTVVFRRTPASRTGITWVRDARGNVFPGCRSGKGAISPLLAGYQKRGEAIIVYDPSTRFSEEDKNEIKEK
ncbi:TPA: hypothetical protein MJA07_22300 [Klebsiella pneumoniae]|nr:hypothetical protein [Klebsiella pneumoniae]